jgi:N-acetylglutamate synthase-like GNAT family acetyltransferase
MNRNEIKIRRFRESDAMGVSKLIHRCWEEMDLGDYDQKGIRLQIESTEPEKLVELSKNITFFVAEHENNVAGFGGHDQELVRLLFVTPEYQRKGIGSSLLEMILNHAREKGIKKLECNSTIYAVPFYAKNGFLEKGAVDFKIIHFSRMSIEILRNRNK